MRVVITNGFEKGRQGTIVRRNPTGAILVLIDGYSGPVTLSPNDVEEICVPQTTRTWNYGGWRDITTCATHTYFGNGVEPNDWPCHPDTRKAD